MTNKKRPNVFISSTHDDLIQYRQIVRDVLLELGLHPVMMEYFPAMERKAVEQCLVEIDSADVYIGIFAHRYGFCPEGSEISVTEMEFDRAAEIGIPRLCFLIDENYAWTPKHIESEPQKTKLFDFKRNKIDKLLRATFTTPETLALKIAISLIPYLSSNSSENNYLPTIRSDQTTSFESISSFVYVIEVQIAMNEIVLCANRLTQLTSKVGEDFKKVTVETLEAVGDLSKLPTILELWRNSLLEYAIALKGQNVAMSVYWRIFALQLVKLITLADIHNISDEMALKRLRGELLDLKDKIQSSTGSMIVFRDSFENEGLKSFDKLMQSANHFDFGYCLYQAQSSVQDTVLGLTSGIEATNQIILEIDKLLG